MICLLDSGWDHRDGSELWGMLKRVRSFEHRRHSDSTCLMGKVVPQILQIRGLSLIIKYPWVLRVQPIRNLVNIDFSYLFNFWIVPLQYVIFNFSSFRILLLPVGLPFNFNSFFYWISGFWISCVIKERRIKGMCCIFGFMVCFLFSKNVTVIRYLNENNI